MKQLLIRLIDITLATPGYEYILGMLICYHAELGIKKLTHWIWHYVFLFYHI